MNINWLSCLFFSTLLASAALVSTHAFAQAQTKNQTQVQAKAPEQSKPESPKTDDASDKNKDDKTKTKTPVQTKPSGSFNPTEEISEDLSVSFPVDI